MNQQRLEELLILWEENQLAAPELTELKQLLTAHPEARQRMVETGVLESIAQTREQAWNQQGSAGDRAITNIATDSASRSWSRWLPYLSYAAAACVAVVALLLIKSGTPPTPPMAVTPTEPRHVAVLLSVDSAVWPEGFVAAEAGENLRESTIELLSGRIELRFLNGALVAIQGPAKFRLESESRMSLRSGRLSADVPPRAVGFTVETPVSEVRDLGTRFGVAVDESGATETHVFDGEVDVWQIAQANNQASGTRLVAPHGLAIQSSASAPVALVADPAAFPLPVRLLNIALPCADFEPNANGWGANDALPPSEVNVWGGDHIVRVGAERGVQPKSGSGMLRFMGAMRPGQSAKSSGGASELFCWIDLRQFSEQFKGRRVTAEFSTWFNRIPSERSEHCAPTVIAATYGPGTTPGLRAWEMRLLRNNSGHALSNCDAEIRSDDDVTSWEQGTARVTIAPHAELLLLSIRVRSDDPDPNLRQFDDVYADAPALIFRLGDALDDKDRLKTGESKR